MSDTGTTFATWKETVAGKLPKHQCNRLLVEAQAHGLTSNDLTATCEEFGVAPRDLLNELSMAVAEGYLAGALTYEFCEGVMNGVIAAIVDVGMTNDMPQPAFSLYQAFDQGEWRRRDDPSETDPGEKYVRPLVVQIVREFQGGSGHRSEVVI
ncbi:hypothetical protein AAIM60_26525 [Pseudomonas lijiangensis]|uniref:hypothetical protein n=1 Tax=Pseudomonas lijiangensis TaxID=2995658 RepID=UPI0031B9F02B